MQNNLHTISTISLKNCISKLGHILTLIYQNNLLLKNIIKYGTNEIYIEVVGANSQAILHQDIINKLNINDINIINNHQITKKELYQLSSNMATYSNNCSLILIKPHALHHCGDIINILYDNKVIINAIQLYTLDKTIASEFLEVYKTVLPEYHDMVQRLQDGPLLALEVTSNKFINTNTIQQIRQISGPYDPQIAKHIRPKSLRAQFGIDKAQNAIHCTDLPEDGKLESEFFFLY